MFRRVLVHLGEYQLLLEVNCREAIPTEPHRTLETAGPRWLFNAGRRVAHSDGG